MMRFVAALLCSLALMTAANAEEPTDNTRRSTTQPYSVAELNDAIGEIEIKVKNIDVVEFYKEWTAYDITTDKEVSLNDLSPVQRFGFFLYRGEVLHNNIGSLKISAINLKNSLKISVDKSEDEDKKIYTKLSEDLEKASARLEDVHSNLAKKRESLTEMAFALAVKQNNKELEGELKDYLIRLRTEHDALKLIQRNVIVRPAPQVKGS